MSQTVNIEEYKKRDCKRFFLLWMRRLIIAYILCIAAYFVYVFAIQGATISFVGNIQKKYAKYLVEQSDVFVDYMIDFNLMTSDTKREYTENEKIQIKENLEKQNEFLANLQKRAPDETNSDYRDLYQDMLQIFAFYIQGETMMAEYCYSYSDNYTLENEYSDQNVGLETYTMGKELCNMMGNMILNNFRYINEIRGTEYQSKHNIVELGSDASDG